MTSCTDQVTVLVLDPGCSREQLAKTCAALGWQAQPDIPAPEAQPVEDRLIGQWQGPAGGHAELIDDGFVWKLFISDSEDTDIAHLRALPHWDASTVGGKLADADWREVVCGCRAAPLLGDPTLFLALARLRHRPEAAIRVEAADALRQLLPVMLAEGERLLGQQACQARGAHPLWNEFGPAWLRRQILRWLIHDFPGATPGVESALRAALADPDWEVRAGAIIATTRYRLASLGGLVEHCPLPDSSRDGPDSQDRALLRELRRVALALLAGREPPPLAANASPRLRLMDRLAELLSARVQRVDDHPGLFVHALSTPCMVERDDCPEEVDEGLVCVPSGTGYLGDGLKVPVGSIQNRRFLLSREPVSDDRGPRLFDARAVEAWLAEAATGWRLPTAEEWEYAARGNDGRLFPWGNGHQEDSHLCPGPWGTHGHGARPEWALDSAGGLCRCGPGAADRWLADGEALLRPARD